MVPTSSRTRRAAGSRLLEVYDPSQKANDQFGFSVAISGGTLVVGTMISPAGTELEGAVYVFSNASGNWQQTAYLTLASLPPTTSAATRWRMSGSTIVVGAPVRGRNGAAYVFTNGTSGWTQTAALTATDGAEGDYFGLSVAVLGSNVVVGAPYKGSAGTPSKVRCTSSTLGARPRSSRPRAAQQTPSSARASRSRTARSSSEPQGSSQRPGARAWVACTSSATAEAPGSRPRSSPASDGAVPDGLGNSVSISGTAVLAGAPGHKVGTKEPARGLPTSTGAVAWIHRLGDAGPCGAGHGQFERREGLPPASYVYPETWTSSLFLDDNGVKVTSCPTGYTWKWTVAAVTIPSGVTPDDHAARRRAARRHSPPRHSARTR